MAPTSLSGASQRQKRRRTQTALNASLSPIFLPSSYVAAVVRDRHFVDAGAHPRDLAGDLRLDPEVARLQIQTIGDVADEHLVAGLHVRQVQVGERVGQERQQPVADRVPEIQDAMPARRSQKSRTVDDVGLAFEDGLEQQRVFARVVLEVRVLDDDDIAGGLAEAARHGGALALILRLQEHAHAVVPVELGQNRPRPIPRPVVDDDDFRLDVAEINGEDSSDDFPNRRLLVVAGHHDGQFHEERCYLRLGRLRGLGGGAPSVPPDWPRIASLARDGRPSLRSARLQLIRCVHEQYVFPPRGRRARAPLPSERSKLGHSGGTESAPPPSAQRARA